LVEKFMDFIKKIIQANFMPLFGSKNTWFSLVLLFLALGWPAGPLTASVLSFAPDGGEYHGGDEFLVDVRLEIGEQCVNTVEASIKFDHQYLNLVDFSTGGSFLSLWVARPSGEELAAANRDGRIYFAGGLPGGYCGRVPGDIGPSDVAATLVFRVPENVAGSFSGQPAGLSFTDPTRVLLNDGLGSEDVLLKKEASFRLTPPTAGAPRQEWQTQLVADRLPPEPFVIELRQDPAMFSGQYYVFFTTTDKQSGLDHYEILETKPNAPSAGRLVRWWETLRVRWLPAPAWKIIVPPYLLHDQTLSSLIKVKAVDKAGNEKVVEYMPPLTNAVREMPVWFIFVLVATVASFIFSLLIFFHQIRKNHA